mmetsp:Transcript_53811/g.121619  ORF Transcript_53811/g.121619 Transcript_53811/m.121619 type:complete len:269 (+) Transcript_53811:868-1674(+)
MPAPRRCTGDSSAKRRRSNGASATAMASASSSLHGAANAAKARTVRALASSWAWPGAAGVAMRGTSPCKQASSKRSRIRNWPAQPRIGRPERCCCQKPVQTSNAAASAQSRHCRVSSSVPPSPKAAGVRNAARINRKACCCVAMLSSMPLACAAARLSAATRQRASRRKAHAWPGQGAAAARAKAMGMATSASWPPLARAASKASRAAQTAFAADSTGERQRASGTPRGPRQGAWRLPAVRFASSAGTGARRPLELGMAGAGRPTSRP